MKTVTTELNRMLLVPALLLAFSAGLCFAKTDSVFDVSKYGAQGDGKTLETKAIQAAIDACGDAGGGTVFFGSGTYVSGSLFLTNNIILHLDAGATLRGSTNLNDYIPRVSGYRSYTDKYVDRSLIYAEKVKNVSITGRGTLDGQGAVFWKQVGRRETPYKNRPFMIRMIQCEDVTVRDVTITNAPMWVQHYLACDDVVIDGITVKSCVAANNDGINIDSCHKVRISNCDIRSGDDSIVLKATSDRPCRDVTIVNCVLSSICHAFKLGTESNGGFWDITMSNCAIYNNRYPSIALEMVDGGVLQRVLINNITMRDCDSPFFLRLGNRARPFKAGMERPGVGTFRDVILSNITATDVRGTGSSITGIPGHCMEGVTLENITVRCKGGGSAELVTKRLPEHAGRYPSHKMWGTLPSYGFFVRHVKNITFRNINISFDEPDARPAMIFDDVTDFNLCGIDAQVIEDGSPVLWFKQVQGGMISGCRPTRKTGTFLQVDNGTGITVMNNDFGNVESIVKTGENVDDKEIYMQSNREAKAAKPSTR